LKLSDFVGKTLKHKHSSNG